MKHLTAIEKIVAVAIVAIVIATICAVLTHPTPANYRVDPYTGVTTWTDSEGREMMQSPDGSTRELSRIGQ